MLRILAAILLVAVSGCAHSAKKSGPAKTAQVPAAPVPVEKNDTKLEAAAEKAVEKTEDDERKAPAIQRDVNSIFFRQKDEHPGGPPDAFAPDRVQALEIALETSTLPNLQYYRENREFFDRIQDVGGGFRIVSNAKRLVPYRWTKAGRRKLFAMDSARVKEMVAHPCFSAVEECGESASDGEENTSLLDEWSKKYGEKEFQGPREKIIRDYLAVLAKYKKRASRAAPKKVAENESPKVKRAREAAALVETHIVGVKSLLQD
jgi:hypothetical protein